MTDTLTLDSAPSDSVQGNDNRTEYDPYDYPNCEAALYDIFTLSPDADLM